MKNSERNLAVLENFILHLTHCSDEKEPAFTIPQSYTPEELYRVAHDYIEEDHVDGKENPLDEEFFQGNIVELMGADGEAVGLYMTQRRDVENFQDVFDECERQAEMAEEQWADDDLEEEEQDDAYSAFENYLSEEGFERFWAESVTTNMI